MKVCDMCLTELNPLNENSVKMSNGSIFNDCFSVCTKCRKKLKKYIAFEQNKNNRKGGVKE